MEQLEVTWMRAVKVWWAIVWRGVLLAVVIGFPVGIVVGLMAAIFGAAEQARAYANLIGMVMGIPVGIWVIKMVLNKQFSDFQIALLPSNRAILEQGMQAQRGEGGPQD